jgi:hypothetical protein
MVLKYMYICDYILPLMAIQWLSYENSSLMWVCVA